MRTRENIAISCYTLAVLVYEQSGDGKNKWDYLPIWRANTHTNSAAPLWRQECCKQELFMFIKSLSTQMSAGGARPLTHSS
jgi:hypothetical protein